MNWVMVAGNLGSDAEERFTPSGKKVVSFRIASRTRKGGKDETIWWRVTIWGDRFDKMVPYLKKGTGLMVMGELEKPELWTDREGNQQISLNITAESLRFNPFGKGSGEGGQQQEGQGAGAASGNRSMAYGSAPQGSPFGSGSGQVAVSEGPDDEIPF
jgi:single-strand DNA-binding protein